jgi:microsomal dipeptidase-like Zn-dependent dipeptidase
VGVLFLLVLVLAPAAWAGHPDSAPPNREAEAIAAAGPEAELNLAGTPRKGKTSYTEVTGLLEGHLHAMAFEFLGGRVRCGRPWDEGGIAKALVDCPDHAGNGAGAVLENQLSTKFPLGTHDNTGWPHFRGWPRHDSLTHEQVYYRWLERSWRGGLRLMVNLLVDNEILCQAYPLKKNSCNEMESVRLQIRRIAELQRYIDRKSGGPGKGWLRVVKDPFEARKVINEGKLAVVLGIEVSKLFDCDVQNDRPSCTKAQIDERLDEMYRAGVRDLELVNKFDNGLAGVAMDSGDTGLAVNAANRVQTGRFWQVETCDGPSHDQPQHAGPGNGRDTLLGGALNLFLPPGVTPLYPPQPHCNVRGLSDLGEHLIRRMAQRGMIVDVDHLSVAARKQALALLESLRHSGVISSHSWADEESYPRIYRLGGVVTPSDHNSAEFVKEWQKIRKYRSSKHYFGFGFGSDLNGFSSAAGPRPNNVNNPVRYPFRAIGGAMIDRQRSGTRTYDVNSDGVAHYGLYPDWVEDLRKVGGQQIHDEMGRGAEAYLQMWERSVGVPSRRCRSPHVHYSRRGLNNIRIGGAPNAVLRRAAQPARRNGRVWRWCVGGRKNRRAKTLAAFTRSHRVGLIATTGTGHRAARVAPGMRSSRLRGKVRSIGRGLHVRRAGRGLFVYKVSRGRVRYVAQASRGVSKNRRIIRNYLRMAGLR